MKNTGTSTGTVEEREEVPLHSYLIPLGIAYSVFGYWLEP
eukprot:COSAG02_NODE_970_length_15551_cov_4.985698_5_plen_40_part_00